MVGLCPKGFVWSPSYQICIEKCLIDNWDEAQEIFHPIVVILAVLSFVSTSLYCTYLVLRLFHFVVVNISRCNKFVTDIKLHFNILQTQYFGSFLYHVIIRLLLYSRRFSLQNHLFAKTQQL